jgi:hypothetical protein
MQLIEGSPTLPLRMHTPGLVVVVDDLEVTNICEAWREKKKKRKCGIDGSIRND